MNACSTVTRSAEETFALGAEVGKLLAAGDFIALDGELGAGKTQFVRGIASGAGIDPLEAVSSPTFTLINEYRCRIPLYHLDLYRLASSADVVELGFDDYLEGEGAVIVEWPDRLAGELPSDHLMVRFTILDEDARELSFEGRGERHAALAGHIAHLFGKKMF